MPVQSRPAYHFYRIALKLLIRYIPSDLPANPPRKFGAFIFFTICHNRFHSQYVCNVAFMATSQCLLYGFSYICYVKNACWENIAPKLFTFMPPLSLQLMGVITSISSILEIWTVLSLMINVSSNRKVVELYCI